jgi:hypothetical protein
MEGANLSTLLSARLKLFLQLRDGLVDRPQIVVQLLQFRLRRLQVALRCGALFLEGRHLLQDGSVAGGKEGGGGGVGVGVGGGSVNSVKLVRKEQREVEIRDTKCRGHAPPLHAGGGGACRSSTALGMLGAHTGSLVRTRMSGMTEQ